MNGNESAAPMARYIVRSSDVLQDMRINVSLEGSEKVVWYKERFLTDDEIVEQIVDNATSTALWTVHRPIRGWYLRLRTPSFPPGVFIPLVPLPQTSPYHSEAALSFACRTNLPSPNPARIRPYTLSKTDSETTLTNEPPAQASTRPSLTSEHSYPPTPPTGPVVTVSPPSPRSVHAKLDSVSLSEPGPATAPRPPPPTVRSAVTHFVVALRQPAAVTAKATPSMFSRLVSALKSSTPVHDSSFTLFAIPAPPPRSPAGAPAPAPAPGQGHALTPHPLLVFHDQTPMWTAGSTTGLLEMDAEQCRVLGVEPAFYVAVALTYLEFVEDRDSYAVAAYD
ncbi:uncharacterized protein BXZ73DRAFT_91056 [Epithele typhae]|uniref:uncharacterized protein n=1 Tax=Epithele typhae TaxID=378194 RepID=UPI00200763F6|nr:uncharacterized protein BXZ73DRAFT_91056 [Epithele typhae]KAH9925599.1 hypothetical protein BXZ73DRAFT_91056 [Epithele typhae]